MDIEFIIDCLKEPPVGHTHYYAAKLALEAVQEACNYFLPKGFEEVGFTYFDNSEIPRSVDMHRDAYFIVGIKRDLEKVELIEVWVDRFDFHEKIAEKIGRAHV